MSNSGPVPVNKMETYQSLLAIADHLENVPERRLLEKDHVRELWAMSAAYREEANRLRKPGVVELPDRDETTEMVRGHDHLSIEQLDRIRLDDVVDVWNAYEPEVQWRRMRCVAITCSDTHTCDKTLYFTAENAQDKGVVTDVEINLGRIVLGPNTIDFKPDTVWREIPQFENYVVNRQGVIKNINSDVIVPVSQGLSHSRQQPHWIVYLKDSNGQKIVWNIDSAVEAAWGKKEEK